MIILLTVPKIVHFCFTFFCCTLCWEKYYW